MIPLAAITAWSNTSPWSDPHCYRKFMEQSVGHVPSAKQYLENLSGKLSDSAFLADMEPLLRPSIEYNIHEAYEEFRKHYIEAM